METVLAAISAVAILGLCGFLLASALTDRRAPPDIRLEIGRAETVAQTTHVEIVGRNLGDVTAAGIELRGIAESGATAEASLDYLPPHSERRATLVFPGAVDPAAVTVAVVGFADP